METGRKVPFVNTTLKLQSENTVIKHIPEQKSPWWYNLQYLVAGTVFGILLVKAEAISWFRIQEMFRLQSFHLYGVLGSAVITGIVSIQLIKRSGIKTVYGKSITLPSKKFSKGQIYGGLLFGLGWAVTGACPGPLFAQIGSGLLIVLVTLLSALAGTWVYGLLMKNLPH